jgi:hypothetical protein
MELDYDSMVALMERFNNHLMQLLVTSTSFICIFSRHIALQIKLYLASVSKDSCLS